MRILSKLETRFGRFAVPNVTAALIFCQILVYGLAWAQPQDVLGKLVLIPAKVYEGEIWRLFTFLCQPPSSNPIFAFFFWYLFYLMGTALESTWGAFRYNVYLLVGYIASVAAAFVVPETAATNLFLQSTVFLAFAVYFPNFELRLFFLLPVKVKWLALLTWIFLGFSFAVGGWQVKLTIFASLANFFLFFWREIKNRIFQGRRRMEWQARKIKAEKAQSDFRHRCEVCGITDASNPRMSFRYCSKCEGARAYCSEHLHNHDHFVTAETTK